MKFGICNEMFVNRQVCKVIEHVAELGFHGVELAPFTLTDDLESFPVGEQKKIARCAETNGIEIIGLHWLFVKPEGLHLTTPDDSVRRRTQDFFRKLIEIAVNTSGKILTLGSPDQRSFGENETQKVAVQRTVEFFQELAPELEASNITVALEPLELEHTNFMTRTVEVCEIVDAIGSKAIGITLDTHFLRWEYAEYGTSFASAFKLAGPRLVHLHIQDDNFLAPGTGNADFSEYIDAMRQIGWKAFISVETLGVKEEGQGEKIAADSIAFLRKNF